VEIEDLLRIRRIEVSPSPPKVSLEELFSIYFPRVVLVVSS
jgi:hypothetical protein